MKIGSAARWKSDCHRKCSEGDGEGELEPSAFGTRLAATAVTHFHAGLGERRPRAAAKASDKNNIAEPGGMLSAAAG